MSIHTPKSVRRWLLTLPPALMMLLVACATTGPGGKKSVVLIPTSQEVALGAGMAEQVEASEKVFADTVWQNYLTEVGQKIVAVCDRRDLEYHFKVIESDQVNAFAAPGGYVYFYTGLLREMNSESEMAAVMAHEISHVVARHGIKQLQAALGASLAYELVFGDNNSKAFEYAVQVGLGLLFSGYSREAEREADDYGIYYMAQAGYNPNGALGMFETLAALGGAEYSNVFEQLTASHPETKERIENARKEIAAMQPLSDNLVDGVGKYQRMRERLPAKKSTP